MSDSFDDGEDFEDEEEELEVVIDVVGGEEEEVEKFFGKKEFVCWKMCVVLGFFEEFMIKKFKFFVLVGVMEIMFMFVLLELNNKKFVEEEIIIEKYKCCECERKEVKR